LTCDAHAKQALFTNTKDVLHDCITVFEVHEAALVPHDAHTEVPEVVVKNEPGKQADTEVLVNSA